MTDQSNVIPASIPLDFEQDFNHGNVKKAMAGFTSSDKWNVPVDKIYVLPGLNPRIHNDAYQAHIEDTASSIFRNGFYPDKPLGVFVGDDGLVYVRDGHTRLLAARRAIELGAQIDTLPCVTAAKGSTMKDYTIGLIKSNTGKALAPIEVAVVCKRMSGWGMESSQIAIELDYTTRYVDELLGLLAGPAALVELVGAGKVSASLAIAATKDHGAAEAAKKIVEASKATPGGKVTAKTLKVEEAKKAPAKVGQINPAFAGPGGLSITPVGDPSLKLNGKKAPAKTMKASDPEDVLVVLHKVFDDKNFKMLSDAVQSMVLDLVS